MSATAMRCQVAFLRAINVGGHTVTMKELRELFEALGFDAVTTVIASGNVLFRTRARSAPTLERTIERQLGNALGYEVATFLRSDQELAKVSAYTPFPDVQCRRGDRVHIGFLREAPTSAVRTSVSELTGRRDLLQVRGRELYWLSRGPMSESKITGASLEKLLGGPTTLRNATTVAKIAAKCAAMSE